MRTSSFHAKDLRKLFQRQRIATLKELKEVLGTTGDATVFRKLQQLPYRTSYSDRGRYYTLDDIAAFNDQGLWSFRSARFSRFGTLVSTAEAFVNQSESGYFADELERVLHVIPKEALLNLFRQDRITREKISGRYLYCSCNRSTKKQQLLVRKAQQEQWDIQRSRVDSDVAPDELKAAIILFFTLLNEQQRRLFAGLEALKWGYGGDRKIADLLDIGVKTVALGRAQLLERDIEIDRIRKAGGGRKHIEKKRRR